MPVATNVKTQTGNRIIVQLNGIAVGLARGVDMNDDYGLEPATGIGDIHVQEHVPTVARHSVAVSTMVLITGNLRQLGIAVENGDGALNGLIFDIVTLAKDTGAVLRKYIGCSYGSGSVNVQANAIVVSNSNFMALDVQGTGR